MRHDDDSQNDGQESGAEEDVASVDGVRHADPGPVASSQGNPTGALPARANGRGVARHREGNGHRDEIDLAGLRDLQVEEPETAQAELVLTSSFQGPLPPPEVFAQYEAVLPGAAERILAMTEKVATGHIDNEAKLIDAEIDSAKQGQAFAFLLTLIAVIASIVFFAIGKWIAGTALLSFPVVMLIRSFLTGRSSGGVKEPKELKEK